MDSKADFLEHSSRMITLGTFLLAMIVFFAAPVLALSWRRLPFPGFLVEQTLVVNDRIGEGWSGRLVGLRAPYAVTRVGGVPVTTAAEFNRVMGERQIGEAIPVFTQLPDGRVQLFPSIQLTLFPAGDFLRLFWLPYLVGLAYLGIGLWVFLAVGRTRPGRALSFFCACVALTAGLLFDVLTTHLGTYVWIVAVAMLGGAVISLALRFPVEWKPVERRAWLLGTPYTISVGLSAWGLAFLKDTAHPWRFLTARSVSYLYAALAALFFFGVMLYQARVGAASVTRRQARLVLVGSLLAFTPIVLWFIAPLANIHPPFDSAMLLPGLLLFPLSVGLAIFRYRLLEIDTLVNRAIVYAGLTAVLAGVFTAVIGLSQRLFVIMTGEKSDAAVIITTLIVASAVAPVRTRLQAWVDRQFREVPTGALRTFGEQVQSFVQMNEAGLISRRLLAEAAKALDAESGALVFFEDGRPRIAHTHGLWRGDTLLSVPLEFEGERYGFIMLGPRRGGRAYRRSELDSLNQVSAHVAHAMHVAHGLRTNSLGSTEARVVSGEEGHHPA